MVECNGWPWSYWASHRLSVGTALIGLEGVSVGCKVHGIQSMACIAGRVPTSVESGGTKAMGGNSGVEGCAGEG